MNVAKAQTNLVSFIHSVLCRPSNYSEGKMDWSKNNLEMVRECCTGGQFRTLNTDYFWNLVQETKENDGFCKPSNRLMFEKTFYLNNDHNVRSILSIGYDPENKFAVAARLEMKKTGTVLMMDVQHIESLLKYLKKYENNILSATPIIKCNSEYKFSLHLHRSRILEMCMRGWSINIDEESLKILCRMRSYIEYSLDLYQKERGGYECVFFKVLIHFHYGKKFEEACQIAETDYKYNFFNSLINYHQFCLDGKFLLEFVTNFSDWFATFVRCFAKTLMLNEDARLRSFSLGWPHPRELVSIEKMAKTGLYFTGSLDNAACAFCGLILFKWKLGDDPLLDHDRYKPNCPLLINPLNTQNFPDGNYKELRKMLSILSKKNQNFDEVDADAM